MLIVSPVVSSARRTTLGNRAFPVAAARAWNDLPTTIASNLKHSFFNPLHRLSMMGFS